MDLSYLHKASIPQFGHCNNHLHCICWYRSLEHLLVEDNRVQHLRLSVNLQDQWLLGHRPVAELKHLYLVAIWSAWILLPGFVVDEGLNRCYVSFFVGIRDGSLIKWLVVKLLHDLRIVFCMAFPKWAAPNTTFGVINKPPQPQISMCTLQWLVPEEN
jgi:hypothetical protein